MSCNQKGSSAFSELLAAFLQYTPQEQRTFHSTFSAPVDPNLVLDTQPVMLLSPVDNDLPKAQFGFPPNSVDRYRNLSIVFTHPMDPTTLIEGTTFQFIRMATSTPITGNAFIWDSPVNLIIDPPTELVAGEQYNIQFTSGLKTTKNESLVPFNGIFTSEPSFQMTHTLKWNQLIPTWKKWFNLR